MFSHLRNANAAHTRYMEYIGIDIIHIPVTDITEFTP